MGCTDTGPVEGGTFIDSMFTNPTISGGTISGTELSNVHFSKNVQLDADTAAMLAQQLCDYVKSCVEFPAEDVAAVFKDCNGAAHVPGAQLPTCDQMKAAIDEAVTPVVATTTPATNEGTDVPTDIIGTNRNVMLGNPTAWLKVGEYLIPAYVVG